MTTTNGGGEHQRPVDPREKSMRVRITRQKRELRRLNKTIERQNLYLKTMIHDHRDVVRQRDEHWDTIQRLALELRNAKRSAYHRDAAPVSFWRRFFSRA